VAFRVLTCARTPSPLASRAARSSEIMSALGSARKQRLFFFTGDDRAIGSHAVRDMAGDAQSVDSVVAWSQCREMLLTSADKRQSVLVMDTERGVTKSELVRARARPCAGSRCPAHAAGRGASEALPRGTRCLPRLAVDCAS
jgi:hypothetical protein